jgi:hypothetical protein
MQDVAKSHLVFCEKFSAKTVSQDLSIQLVPYIKDLETSSEIRGIYAKIILDVMASPRMQEVSNMMGDDTVHFLAFLEECVTPEIEGYVALIDSLLND